MTYLFCLFLYSFIVSAQGIPQTSRQLPQGLVHRLPRHGRSWNRRNFNYSYSSMRCFGVLYAHRMNSLLWSHRITCGASDATDQHLSIASKLAGFQIKSIIKRRRRRQSKAVVLWHLHTYGESTDGLLLLKPVILSRSLRAVKGSRFGTCLLKSRFVKEVVGPTGARTTRWSRLFAAVGQIERFRRILWRCDGSMGKYI